MSNELVINSTQSGSRIALLKDNSLVEFHHDSDGNRFTVGDIYLGTVKKVVQGLNAAFIDVGYEKDAFLHYLDLSPQIKSLNKFVKLVRNDRPGRSLQDFKLLPDIDKHGKITQVLSKNGLVLVQVVKEPISTKGPRLSCELSIAGRYVILVPFSNTVNVSKKIVSAEERKRLGRLMSSIKPNNFGVIMRTAAEGVAVADLDKDLRNLVKIWEDGIRKLRVAQPKDKIIGEIGRASSIVRDMFNESFDNIYVDDQDQYKEIRSYIKNIAPKKEKIVKFYKGKSKIFENFGIEKQLKLLFGKTVSIPGGGYLIIEHTEALHVIDVNSGNKSNAEEDQEKTALAVNLLAAKEIARQLRIRDLGGIIVIDFIDMRRSENKRKLYSTIKSEMKEDRSKFTILPLSKFGLMQITRQRVRPELNITTRETCPSCNGTGKVVATISIADDIEAEIEKIFDEQGKKDLTVTLHPYLYAYFTQGAISKRSEWFFKYFKWVKLIKDSSLPITEYIITDNVGKEIEI